jgi:hypothetical protein
MLGALVANLLMPWTVSAVLLLGGQVVFYTLAAIGAGRRGQRLIFRGPHYFVVINLALLRGCFRFLAGRQRAAWQRTAR